MKRRHRDETFEIVEADRPEGSVPQCLKLIDEAGLIQRGFKPVIGERTGGRENREARKRHDQAEMKMEEILPQPLRSRSMRPATIGASRNCGRSE